MNVYACLQIKYDENLPGVVCHVCLYKLNMWSEFKEQFIQSNKSLEQLDMWEESEDNTVRCNVDAIFFLDLFFSTLSSELIYTAAIKYSYS